LIHLSLPGEADVLEQRGPSGESKGSRAQDGDAQGREGPRGVARGLIVVAHLDFFFQVGLSASPVFFCPLQKEEKKRIEP